MRKYILVTLFMVPNIFADSGAPIRGAAIGFIGGCIAYACDNVSCWLQNSYIKMTQPRQELVQINSSTINGALIVQKDLKLVKPMSFKKLIITTTVIGLFAGAAGS